MAEITLVAEVGRATGTRPSRRLRREGRVPAVVYGNGVDAVPVTVAARDLRAALSTGAGLNAVLSLQVGDRRYIAMAREIQRHPVRGTVQHVDFQVVDPDRPVGADVPVVLVGDPVELHHHDGILDQQVFTLSVRARPADIPAHLEADVSRLTVGGVVRVGDIHLPPGVSTDTDPEVIVAIGEPPRVQRAEAGAPEAAGVAAEVAAGPEAAAGAGAGAGGGTGEAAQAGGGAAEPGGAGDSGTGQES